MIKATSPTRVDFAGGTLDCWPLHVLVGDCVTVNLAIDVMTGCELDFVSDASIEIEVTDLNYKQKFKNLDLALASGDSQLKLVQAVLKAYRPTRGFKLKTFSQSPVGGGLGGSSSLCISLIKAFAQAEGVQLKVYETVEMAHNIEAEVIHAPTGTQDYFPALAPGLNLIHYSARGARLEPIDFDEELFSSRLMLIYTGKAHHSGINNWQVLKDVIDGHPKPLNALKKIAKISSQMAQACQGKDWAMIPELFHQEFEARVELSAGFTSPEIETLRRLVLQCGGDAVKIRGAGGGGCVLVWADPTKHETISKECQKKRVPSNKVSSRKTARARAALKRCHFAGLALGGAKSDRTSLAFIEYYPEQNKIFLSELVDKIKNEGELSADTLIIEGLEKPQYKLEMLGINAPLTTPSCLEHKCLSIETCKSDEVQWMWDHYRRQLAQKKNHKLFSPYTERWVDHYISTELEEPFPFAQTLGANTAPIWARAHYLSRNIKVPMLEVNPKVSLWRIGRALQVQKSYLRFHKHQIDGETARRAILKELVERNIAFLYEQDIKILVENIQAFDGFLCALTAVLQFKGQCEERPKDLPTTGGWIEIPKADIIW